MARDEAVTATVVNCDIVDAIGVEYVEVGVGRDGVSTTHAGMVELDSKADGLEGGLDKVSASSHLKWIT